MLIFFRLNSRDNELNHTEISIPSLLIHDHKIEVNIGKQSIFTH
jgi:hypothetical protein